MAKSANINVRIDPETKKRAEDLFSSFGITITDAINIFLRKSIMEGGLPFDVRLPEHPLDASRMTAEQLDAVLEKGMHSFKQANVSRQNKRLMKFGEKLAHDV